MSDEDQTSTIIKHLVISGGGPQGFSFYGILRESNRAGLWSYDHLKSIYGTSIGAFLAVILCLQFDWDILDDFLIKRPWHTVLRLDLPSYLRVFETKGIVDKRIYEEVMRPLFAAKDIPIDITMKGLYDLTGIELHIFTTEMNQLEAIDISHHTYPDWPVTKALHCSSALPIVFEPYIENNCVYIDGGIIMNYPIRPCIENGANPDEILGIYKKNDLFQEEKKISQESSFYEYILGLLNRVFDKTLRFYEGECPRLKHEYYIMANVVSIENLKLAATSMEERQRLIQIGVDTYYTNLNDVEKIED